MKTFKSIYLGSDKVAKFIPDDTLINNELEFVGYTGFVPKTFIADLLIVSRYKLFQSNINAGTEYIVSLQKIFEEINIMKWLRDTISVFKRISEKYDLRALECYALDGKGFDLSNVKFSFNYSFHITKVSDSIKLLLNITEDHVSEIEKLPEEVIQVLTISNGYGKFMKTSQSIVNTGKPMKNYGDIIHVHKHNLADPLFNYKFSIKSYDIDAEVIDNHRSKKLVIGYFLNSFSGSETINILIKLLGVLSLLYSAPGMEVVVYYFYSFSYQKVTLNSAEDIINYFSKPQQLQLYPVNNTTSLTTLVTENKGDEIIFLPNMNGDCIINSTIASFCKINMISMKESQYNVKYSNICKQTGGIFLTI